MFSGDTTRDHWHEMRSFLEGTAHNRQEQMRPNLDKRTKIDIDTNIAKTRQSS